MKIKKKEVILEERGWPGHYVWCSYCEFRRNSLVTCEDVNIVVSTVGFQTKQSDTDPFSFEVVEIAIGRHYETMAFVADNSEHKNADIDRKIELGCKWEINLEGETEKHLEADDMHGEAVMWVADQLLNGTLEIPEKGLPSAEAP